MCCVFNVLTTSTCASRHNGVHFFYTFSTSQRPKVARTCGVLTFWLEMRFVPQRRALFRHVCQLPKAVRAWCVLYILPWKCASCHNGVHFFDMSTSKSGPSMVCFVHVDLEMCFALHGVHFFDSSTSKSAPNVRCFFHLQMCFAPQRRATFHFSFGQMAPHPPL